MKVENGERKDGRTKTNHCCRRISFWGSETARAMERQRDQLLGCGGVRPETVSAERNMARKRAEKERRWCYGEREGDEGRREGGEKQWSVKW
jgi:hypothetical protein